MQILTGEGRGRSPVGICPGGTPQFQAGKGMRDRLSLLTTQDPDHRLRRNVPIHQIPSETPHFCPLPKVSGSRWRAMHRPAEGRGKVTGRRARRRGRSTLPAGRKVWSVASGLKDADRGQSVPRPNEQLKNCRRPRAPARSPEAFRSSDSIREWCATVNAGHVARLGSSTPAGTAT